MPNIRRSLGYLFDRPCEPLILPKGDNKAVFQLTEQFLAEQYKRNGLDLNNRFGENAGEMIPLTELETLPDLSKAKQLRTNAEFSIFVPKHQEMATHVIDILMAVPHNNLQQFLSTCVYCRVHLNPQLFNYAFCVALLHRRDTKNIPIQNFAETFPSKFVQSQAFSKARESTTVIPKDKKRTPITIPKDYTATDLEVEHRLAYWREDIGVNLHHWHWHLTYPYNATDRSIVAKDRRGELFLYMHHGIMSRYNCERLDNGLKRAVKFSNWREPIPEAYYSKLDSLTSSRGYSPRQANMRWQDIDRPADGVKITIDTMEGWRRNLEEAISTGLVKMPDGSTQPLTADEFGNMMEASVLSPNINYYGSVHNNGHVIASYIHDPDQRYLEQFAVIGDTAINMRDPFFYRWHAWIDDMYMRYKESPFVKPYTRSELAYQGVKIESASVKSSTGKTNVFETFWMQSDLDLSRGLDFSNRGPVYVRFTHLNHRPFKYVIKVNNLGNARRGTVRIFMARKYDEHGQPWHLNDHRKMFIEMDRFVVLLNAGQNTITRQSIESTLTIPFEQTFRDLSAPSDNPKDIDAFNFCGCGWPQHMLVPRGTEAGSNYQLFFMISNYDHDKVNQPDDVGEISCAEASSFCGLKDRLYPDKRSMGFPFDRPSNTANVIKDFILENMALVECTIKLNNVTEQNPKNPKEPKDPKDPKEPKDPKDPKQ